MRKAATITLLVGLAAIVALGSVVAVVCNQASPYGIKRGMEFNDVKACVGTQPPSEVMEFNGSPRGGIWCIGDKELVVLLDSYGRVAVVNGEKPPPTVRQLIREFLRI